MSQATPARIPLATAFLLAVGAFSPTALPTPAQAQQPPPPLPQLGFEVAFPQLRFDRPVALAYPNDGGDRLFVVEQKGVIRSFPNELGAADAPVFLDIQDRVLSPARGGHNEEGLLGLAFHPNYAENGQFFVYYSAQEGPTGRRSVVARYRVDPSDPLKADPSIEERIWLSEPDPYGNHNGGCIEFGPDGYLYISLGDSGSADDPLVTGQNPSDWWGSILRIDVDNPANGQPYGIPADNPRLRDPRRFRDWAPEVYAIGIRNIWKFTFDRETGACWAGDVGQNLWEEVILVVNGGNYGWSAVEGFHPFPKRQRRPVRPADLIPPVFEYPHGPNQPGGRTDTGLSITGGYVYRGQAIPDLVGAYVMGDYDTGRVWALRVDDKGTLTAANEVVDLSRYPKLNVAAFGEDRAGELYILAFDGRIYRVNAAE